LAADNVGFGDQQFLPTHLNVIARAYMVCQAEKHRIVLAFGEVKSLVEPGEVDVRSYPTQHLEAFAGTSFDEGGNEQAVKQFLAAPAAAHTLPQCRGIVVSVCLLEASAPALEQAANQRQVGRLIPRHGGQLGTHARGQRGSGQRFKSSRALAAAFFSR
jgi:hypothetical protein